MRAGLATYLELLISFQCLLFACFLVLGRRRREPGNSALALLLALLGVHLGGEFLQQAGVIGQGLRPFQFAGLLYGPLFARFFAALSGETAPRGWRALLHLLPCGLALAAWTAGWMNEERLALAVFASLAGYLAWSGFRLREYERALEATRSSFRRAPLAWLRFALLGLCVVAILDVVSFATGRVMAAESAWPVVLRLALLAYVSGFVFAALERPRLFTPVVAEDRALAQIAPAEWTAADAAELARVETQLAADRSYLDPDLTLSQLAARVRLPPRRLSVLVNRGRRRNFAEWINDWRLEEAKRQLTDPAQRERSVLDILLASGFNSKSTFNALFKRRTGTTPTRYRQTGST